MKNKERRVNKKIMHNLDWLNSELGEIKTPKDIIKLPINYIEKTPPYYTFDQLKEKLINQPDNQIQHWCLTGDLNAYLVISEDFISDSFLDMPEGEVAENASYQKRYRGLEKLKIKDDTFGFDLERLFENGYLIIGQDNIENQLDTTYLEAKFNITRTFKRAIKVKAVCSIEVRYQQLKDNNKIEISDLVFIEQDVERLFVSL